MTEDFRARRRRIRVAGQRSRPGGAVRPPEPAPGLGFPGPDESGADAAATAVPVDTASFTTTILHDPAAPDPADRSVPEPTDPTAPEEEAVAAAPIQPAVRGRRGRVLVPVALGAVVVALAVVAAIVTSRAGTAAADESARTPALVAAESAATALLSVDYRHLDADLARANTYLAPGFRKQYDSFRQSLAGTYTHAQTVIVAEVTAGGVRDVTADHAVALVFVDQLTTGTNRGSGRLDRDRVRLTMVHTGGRWLVAALDAI